MAERNEPCACGSGKKFKACCARRRTRSQWAALASVVVFAVVAAWVLAGVLRRAASDDFAAEAAQPSGPAPPGKVWSTEHGHWHDAPVPGGMPPPPGPAPEGKVWSVEHGHWHDVTAGGVPGEPAPPEEEPDLAAAAGDADAEALSTVEEP